MLFRLEYVLTFIYTAFNKNMLILHQHYTMWFTVRISVLFCLSSNSICVKSLQQPIKFWLIIVKASLQITSAWEKNSNVSIPCCLTRNKEFYLGYGLTLFE